MKHDPRRCAPRVPSFLLFRHRCALILVLGWIHLASSASGAPRSKLSEVIEEASKPVQEQGFVERESAEDDDGNWFINFLIDIFFGSGSDSPESESQSESASEPEYETVSGSYDDWSLALTSLHIQPADGVLTGLSGGGVEATARMTRRVHMEGGLYWLLAELRSGSAAQFALRAPKEIALALRARTYFAPDHVLGLNAFLGIRGGVLYWDYRNPVFAIDDYGYGEEVWNDSIASFAPFWGIGVRPLLGRHVDVGVELGAGWRAYNVKTFERFENDVFKDNWYWHGSVRLAFRF